jgi:hypothetical protein
MCDNEPGGYCPGCQIVADSNRPDFKEVPATPPNACSRSQYALAWLRDPEGLARATNKIPKNLPEDEYLQCLRAVVANLS